ncbi:Abi family protein [Vagococcus lutrae]|uniref:Abi family protein n=1 Tax=Vagococcus lutrae TaxID=81947 RepID=UPI00232DE371|nr:Abi family protein [Vagococcus lutrae]MDT2818883.1 Abi family protein [Vagococcus lutrae]MDT2842869.1 Abi family protein [Vagococcus lutrae]MDT2843550.1 Abi family protein [Vagococcus lutrae]WCG04437.1 Abi family protein [Vagococcus lutrae]
MAKPQHLTFQQQLELFESRGMIINKNDINKIQVIGYYRIKQFASPIAKKNIVNGKVIYDYTGINFSDVLKRYYQDKNLRSNLLHALEKVEVALKTRVSFILGNNYGAFGYLYFSNWCDKSNYSKFEIEKRQFFFKKDLKRSISHSCSEDVKNKDNLDSDGFPSIWLAVEVLTFGEIVRLVEVMSVKNKTELAKTFNCTHKELLSWMKCLNFVRNICAHNSNIIDMQLDTKPICKEEWKKRLYIIKNNKGQSVPSNKLAIVLLILEHFILTINKKYAWRKVHNNISRITDGKEKNAKLMGFSDKESANKIFNK